MVRMRPQQIAALLRWFAQGVRLSTRSVFGHGDEAGVVLRMQKDGKPAALRRNPQECLASGWRRTTIGWSAVFLACLAASACSSTEKRRPCPPVRLADGTDRVTFFRNGTGRDITDIDAQVRLVNFTGGCDYDGDKAELNFTMDFVVEKGPANRSGRARFDYFVAIPHFYPNPAGKKMFSVAVKFPEGAPRVVRREEIHVAVPIPAKTRPREFPIYVGLQLTPAQIDYNQTRAHRP